LADRFVKDPNQVVKVGQTVQVRVLSVDLQRKRIGLTMRSGAVEKKAPQTRPAGKPQSGAKPPRTEGDLAAALKKSGFRVKPGKES